MRSALGVAIVTVALACHSQYHPLDVADECACTPSQYCKVSGGTAQCIALPMSCGDRPTCDCVGDPHDACRDEDGRITLLPARQARSCDECSKEEYCFESAGGSACRVLPPECDATRTCACFLGARNHSARFACDERAGHVVAHAL
jgi:hypothetical protein